jgi:pyruvate, orthophosphate dikinase
MNFCPVIMELINELADLKLRVKHAATLAEIDQLLQQIRVKERIRRQAEQLREQNPMLGMRGVRLGIHDPRIDHHAGAGHLRGGLPGGPRGVKVLPKVMIPSPAM